MEDIFEQLKKAVTPAEEQKTAMAMDSIADRMADAAAASYIASIAEDGEFKEEAHPREAKGGKGAGRFRTSGKTIEKEDDLGGADDVDDDLLDRCDKKITEEEVIRLKKVATKTSSPEILRKLAFAERYTSSNANCEIQEAVANNPNTPKDILKHLVGFPRQNEDHRGKIYLNDVATSAKATIEGMK